MTKQQTTADAILDTALRLASSASWEKLNLHTVAREMNIPLHEIHRHYAQKDDLVEAWYDQADRAMLSVARTPGFTTLTTAERLHLLLMRWLDSLAEYKTVSRDMLLYKLEPAHIHLQLQGILRISRTVQWVREAALQEATHLRRIIEEIGLTSLYLQTVLFWMTDNSDGQIRTRQFLHRRLAQLNRCDRLIDKFHFLIPGSVRRQTHNSQSGEQVSR